MAPRGGTKTAISLLLWFMQIYLPVQTEKGNDAVHSSPLISKLSSGLMIEKGQDSISHGVYFSNCFLTLSPAVK